MTPLRDLVARATVETRFYGAVLALFAGIALLLAGVGVYGLVSQSVLERVREFGIRLALGAVPPQILRMVLRQTAWPIAIGAFAGLAIARSATRVLSALLFNTHPTDVPTLATVALVLAGVGLAAAWFPARAAARANPVEALRSD